MRRAHVQEGVHEDYQLGELFIAVLQLYYRYLAAATLDGHVRVVVVNTVN